MDSLASFYDACAQLEIDDFGDYDKAGRAMQESIALLESSTQMQRDSKLGLFRQRLAAIQTFIDARQVLLHLLLQSYGVPSNFLPCLVLAGFQRGPRKGSQALWRPH